MKSNKGVSPIIATLLLIVIAVAAAVVTYGFVMGFLGTTAAPAGTEISDARIVVEAVETNSTQSPFNVTKVVVRNVGSITLNITGVYLYTADGTILQGGSNGSINVNVKPGEAAILIAPFGDTGFALQQTTNLYIKATTDKGTAATSQQFRIKK